MKISFDTTVYESRRNSAAATLRRDAPPIPASIEHQFDAQSIERIFIILKALMDFLSPCEHILEVIKIRGEFREDLQKATCVTFEVVFVAFRSREEVKFSACQECCVMSPYVTPEGFVKDFARKCAEATRPQIERHRVTAGDLSRFKDFFEEHANS